MLVDLIVPVDARGRRTGFGMRVKPGVGAPAIVG
jgi:hypothetical protein